MFVMAVTVFVEPSKVDDFVEAILDNARASREEPGNLRFDVVQSRDDPARFLLYEVYLTEEDFRTHQRTPHYLRFRERVAAWMARPREGVAHTSLFPTDDDAW
jgi:autoinducer 2-degrading protein